MPRLYFLATPRLATGACTAMDLYSALLAIEPALLLEERPAAAEARLSGPGSFAEEGAWAGASIEEEAAAAYASSRECRRLPYGMPGWAAEARKAGYLETERKLFGALRRMAEAGALRPADVSALAAAEGARRVYDELFSLPLSRINHPSFLSRLEAVEDARRLLAVSACSRYPALAPYAPRLGRIAELLARRRAAMATDLLAALGRDRADAAVLVGAAEKGRLERDVGRAAAGMGYAIANFWES